MLAADRFQKPFFVGREEVVFCVLHAPNILMCLVPLVRDFIESAYVKIIIITLANNEGSGEPM